MYHPSLVLSKLYIYISVHYDMSAVEQPWTQWDRSGRPQQNRERENRRKANLWQEAFKKTQAARRKKTNTCKNQKSQAAIVTVATNPNTRQTRLPERDEPASHLAAKWLRWDEDGNPNPARRIQIPQWGERGRQHWGTFTTTRKKNSQPERTDCRNRLQDRTSAKTNSLPIAQELKKRRKRRRKKKKKQECLQQSVVGPRKPRLTEN